MLPLSEEALQQLKATGWLREVAFRTEPRTNKLEIKAFLEAVHGMEVERVSTINYQGKRKRVVDDKGRSHFRRESDWKKAYVTFRPPPEQLAAWQAARDARLQEAAAADERERAARAAASARRRAPLLPPSQQQQAQQAQQEQAQKQQQQAQSQQLRRSGGGYVRQGSALWRQLHEGMLTTSLVKQALGMHEPKAAGVIGIHPGQRGGSALISAYFHLRGSASGGGGSAAGQRSSSSAGGGDAAAAAAANEAARRAFNARPAADEGAGVASADELRAQCERAALGGDVPVKLAWGSVQEHAALHALLQLFPDAAVEEVGLCEVDTSALPPAWLAPGGPLSAADLPRLGASPDGLLVHALMLPRAELRAAAAALARGGDGDGEAAVRGLLRGALDAVRCMGTRPRGGVPVEDSSSEEGGDAAAGGSSDGDEGDDAAARGSDGGRSGGSDAGAAGAAPEAAGAGASAVAAAVAGLALSPARGAADGGCADGRRPAGERAEQLAEPPSVSAAGGLCFAPTDEEVLKLLQQAAEAEQAAEQAAGGGDVRLLVREVVEVKSHCPFAVSAKRSGKKGRVRVTAGFRPRGPAPRVQPQWVPQLQLHMLATGCSSALLVSRCAHEGVRAFRLFADREYQRTMLSLLALLQRQHVAPGVPPSAATFAGVPGYRAFLSRTVAIARGAVCVAEGDAALVARVPDAPDGSNRPRFW
ncbi:rplW [Scenedesmus sp. PABB004]|nr:rplW [Scenedesmus sp. PABB004]